MPAAITTGLSAISANIGAIRAKCGRTHAVISTPSVNTLEHSASRATRKFMAWTKNVNAYPATLQEIWVRLMETGDDSIHEFETPADAKKFQKNMMALRYAYINSPEGPYRVRAAGFVAEIVSAQVVRMCSVDNTERARLGSKALLQRRAQDKARGTEMMEFASISPDLVEPIK